MSPVKTTPKMMYAMNFVRSSIAPNTIASDTATKTTWKKNCACGGVTL